MRRSLAPLLVLAALTFVVGLGAPALTDSDEAFYGEAAREMVESGNWLTPYYNYEPRFQKPILYYWATAATFVVTGATEWSARLWAALSGVALVFVTAGLARRWYDDDTALLAGAIVATSFGYVALGRMALPDLPLALAVTATIACCLVAIGDRVPRPRRWLVAAAVAAALGFLTKGPLAVVLPGAVVLPIVMIERRASRLRPVDVVVAAAVFVVVAAPWYLAMWATHGSAYMQSFFVGDNLERFATDRFNEPRAWWYYGPVVVGGVAPWAPFLLLGLGSSVRVLTGRGGPGSLETRLVIWMLMPLVIFTLSVGKQPRYVLPLLPPIAMLLAHAIVERTQARRGLDGGLYRQQPDRGLQAASMASGAILVVAAALVWRARPLFVDIPVWHSLAATGVVAFAGLAVVVVAAARAWRRAPWALACASAVAMPALVLGALGGGPDDPVHRVARAVLDARHASEPVGVSRVFVRNLIFYTGVKQTDLITDEQLTAFLSQSGQALVVVPADVLERVEAAGAPRATRLAEFPYLNQAGLRLRSFLWPEPAHDVQRVLVVRTSGTGPAPRP
ncbi:MAG: glycosyltransferase family 39 protein [Acidobacteriota bacterium]